ncbi:PAS domain S-box protein [Flavobacterium franklandianum]|uniref:histidine kinase n=1 Tax=Flavobacterium franklandianum TaxID=2594430 RepID=A0A553CN74_9FLAO|nr:PAS domain S-box protein [Flavobacterium franklandianum]TRX22053.1 PAS domain S-box protein [Flavobacterium franklandianum]
MNTEKLWYNIANWFMIRPRTSGFLLFLFLVFTVIIISAQRVYTISENQDNEMNVILNDINQSIEHSLIICYTTTVALELSIDDAGIPQNFDLIGKELFESNPIVSNVQIVPNGVIKYMYPLKGNEAAMNLNVLTSNSLQKESNKCIKAKKIFFAGPFKLAQGGIGIMGILPVHKENKFWGFTAVVIKLETLLDIPRIKFLDKSKYEFQFSKKNPITNKEEFFIPSKLDLSKSYYKNYAMPDSDWNLYLIAKKPYSIYAEVIIRLFLGLIIAIALSILTSRFLKKPIELKLLLKEQEEKLLKNEMKFKSMFEQTAVGFALVDASSGCLIEANDKFCDMLGYTSDEIKDKHFTNFTHHEDVEKSIQNFKSLGEGKIKEYSVEKRYITKSGNPIWVQLTVSRLWESNQKPSTNITVIKDITSKKEAQAQLEKSETRFKSIFENSPLPLWEKDFSAVKNHLVELDLMNKKPETVYSFFDEHPDELYKCVSLVKIIDVNHECLKLHKVKDKALLLENVIDLIDIEPFDEVKQQLVAISQNVKQFSIDSQIKISNGQIRDINLRWNIIEGYEDSLERVILSTQDITDSKIAEADILNSHQRTESLINTIDGIVWEFDFETMTFTFVSKKVETILGYTVAAYMGIPNFWEDHIYPEDREYALRTSKLVNKTHKNHDYEYRMIAKDGKIIWIRDIVNFVIEIDKPVISRGIMIDITIMKEAEKTLNNSLYLVSEQNKRLLNFSYIVSHNLRSHTSNIESIISLIESADTEEERNEMMHLLKSVSLSLDETMSHLNEVVNINTNIGLMISPLNLNIYFTKAKDILCEQIQLNEVSFVTNVTDDAVINYNPAYLESILYNLISNAIRYRHPQRKPIITIKLYNEKGENVIEVSDNGIGIDLARNGDKIFGMYKTFSNNPESRGIGLFITKNQVDAMGGTITVASDLNIGTTFKIYIK